MPRQICTTILLLFSLLLLSRPATATDLSQSEVVQSLVPHKALYEIRLLSKRSGTQIININGKMFYEWTKGCDAWETKHRFDLLYEYSDGPSMRVTSDFSTFEAFDDSGFDFSSRRMRDGDVFEETRGHAKISDQGKGLATYTLPEKTSYKLPKGSMFPMGHTIKVLEQIKAGKKIYAANIFDGSDELGPREVNVIIGKTVQPPKALRENKNIDQDILSSPAHKLRLAYFILAEDGSEAEHEMDVIFHDNGLISSMIVDYGEFSVAQTLIALEPVSSTCEQMQHTK